MTNLLQAIYIYGSDRSLYRTERFMRLILLKHGCFWKGPRWWAALLFLLRAVILSSQCHSRHDT